MFLYWPDHELILEIRLHGELRGQYIYLHWPVAEISILSPVARLPADAIANDIAPVPVSSVNEVFTTTALALPAIRSEVRTTIASKRPDFNMAGNTANRHLLIMEPPLRVTAFTFYDEKFILEGDYTSPTILSSPI